MKTNSVVIAFIAVLVAGAVFFEKPDQWFEDGAKLAPVKGDFPTISTALKTYKINAGHYPSTEQGLKALVELRCVGPDGVEGNKDDRVSE